MKIRSVIIATGLSLMAPPLAQAEDAKKTEPAGVPIGSKVQHFSLKTMNPELSGARMVASRHFLGPKAKFPTKAIGVTFGASYCEPCKKELKVLATKSKAIKDAGYTLLSVVIDKEPEGIEAMRKLLVDELKVDFPVLSDRFGILARRYKATSLPMMLVINPEGKITWLHVGYEKKALGEFLAQLGVSKKRRRR